MMMPIRKPSHHCGAVSPWRTSAIQLSHKRKAHFRSGGFSTVNNYYNQLLNLLVSGERKQVSIGATKLFGLATSPIPCSQSSHLCSSSLLNKPRHRIRCMAGLFSSLMDTGVANINSEDIEMMPGLARPFGPSLISKVESPVPNKEGVNFALAAPRASSVKLCLFDRSGNMVHEGPMHRSEDGTWTSFIPNLPRTGVLYGYRVSGDGDWSTPFRWDDSRILLDPWAPLVVGRAKFGVRDAFEKFQPGIGSQFLGTYDFVSAPFDWGPNYKKPGIAPEDTIIMELPIRSFTAHPSSGLKDNLRGTFAGLTEKVPELVKLGITAVELLPVFEYDELEFQVRQNPRDHMTNIWGYSHLSFLAPMSRFGSQIFEDKKNKGASMGSDPIETAREFKEMVKCLHNAGIEVILDVVYNHTAEADDENPYLISWRGIDALEYYQQDPHAERRLVNTSGCGNTFNSNKDLGLQLILHSLRTWVEEYHVDGFRFDLASCLCRDSEGKPMDDPPVIRAIAEDPVLKAAGTKLIAEPWDLGLYQVGSFPRHGGLWSEWNGQYRDDIRKFIRGDAGMKPNFASRLAGSESLYGTSERKPYHSINFVIAHDGFTLWDSVCYNEKHNEANGEENRDGTNDNFSWNCGFEGPTSDEGVNAIRKRQVRNFHLALMLSQGTPMLLSGDEYCQSRHGNNNWYGHDSEMTQYRWDSLENAKSENSDGWYRFYSGLINFRRRCPMLGRTEFLTSDDVTWHEDRWDDPESRFLAFTLHDTDKTSPGTEKFGDIYAAFNAHPFEVTVPLPSPPAGMRWVRLVDTNLPSPRDWKPEGNSGVEATYKMQGFSSILLLARKDD